MKLRPLMRYQRGMFTPVGFNLPYPGTLLVEAASFDGTTDFGLKGSNLSGMSDSKLMTIVQWYYYTSLPSVSAYCYHQPNSAGGSLSMSSLRLTNSGGLEVLGRTGVPGNALIGTISAGATSAWHCVMFSVDMSDTGKRHFYLDDADASPTWTQYLDVAIGFGSGADFAIGGQANTASKWASGLGPLWYGPGVYIDFSVRKNRRKFLTETGKPANVGASGERVTGSAPAWCSWIADGAAASNAYVNRGTGGSVTDQATITLFSSSPSD